jgi:hypothetical protein
LASALSVHHVDDYRSPQQPGEGDYQVAQNWQSL